MQHLLALFLPEGLLNKTYGDTHGGAGLPVQHLQQALHPEELSQRPHAAAPWREVLWVLHLQEEVLTQDPAGEAHGPAQHSQRHHWAVRECSCPGSCLHSHAYGRPWARSWSGCPRHASKWRCWSRGWGWNRSGCSCRSELPRRDHLRMLRLPCQVWPNGALQWPHANACLRWISTTR